MSPAEILDFLRYSWLICWTDTKKKFHLEVPNFNRLDFTSVIIYHHQGYEFYVNKHLEGTYLSNWKG